MVDKGNWCPGVSYTPGGWWKEGKGGPGMEEEGGVYHVAVWGLPAGRTWGG